MQTIQRKNLQALMLDCERPMRVTFQKKDKSWKTITGEVEYIKGHNKMNPAAHMGKYVTLVVDRFTNPKWKNVNLETVDDIWIGVEQYKVEGKLFD